MAKRTNNKIKTVKPRVRQNSDGYKWGQLAVQLPAFDADIDVRLPNGQALVLQFRVESPSIDICLPFNTPVTNWKGTDMESAPVIRGSYKGKNKSHIRVVGQLVIALPEETLKKGGHVKGSFGDELEAALKDTE